MKYLIAVSSLTPGSGLSRYVLSLCGLLSDGNEVYVVTTHNSDNVSYEQKELADISDDIKLISLGTYPTFKKYYKAIQLVRTLKPDIIINNYNAVYQFILPLLPGRTKVVHILHCDNNDFYRVAAISAGHTDGWIAPSRAIARHFNEYTSQKYTDRIKVISHGVEETELKEKQNQRLEIIYAGVLYEHKGVKILPEIIKRLLHKGIDLHFTIIGGGVLEEWLTEQFKGEIKTGIVSMTGVISHDEVYAYMSKSDIFLYPTHLDSFGLVIAEAMMNGAVPIVTLLQDITDHLIPDEHYGYLIQQDDIDNFVESISKLAESVDLRESISRNAHHRALELFSHQSMKEAYLNYLRNLN